MAKPTQVDTSHSPKTLITTPGVFHSLMNLLSIPNEVDHSHLVLPYMMPYYSYGIRHSHPRPQTTGASSRTTFSSDSSSSPGEHDQSYKSSYALTSELSPFKVSKLRKSSAAP
ncbi:hypothetical protein Slin15195_G044600 [Septoria linicola]|uniref:Uncharacterized protein n=1 Tax=Septoria linicola TaxID=215465 RepID=A0A9Q9ASF2_9PEZI|nr:hypothetical protein Slin14017_G048120 [Septoria linicola]USW51141.1 hypothetical protein Slin15195_G044600 [Septoria linicola]